MVSEVIGGKRQDLAPVPSHGVRDTREIRRKGTVILTIVFLLFITIGVGCGFIETETVKALEPVLRTILDTTLQSRWNNTTQNTDTPSFA